MSQLLYADTCYFQPAANAAFTAAVGVTAVAYYDGAFTQLMPINAVTSGAPGALLPNSTLTVDAYSNVAFYAPDGYQGPVYLKAGSSSAVVYPRVGQQGLQGPQGIPGPPGASGTGSGSLSGTVGGGTAATAGPTRVVMRVDTAAGWTAANPTLLSSEQGQESDTKLTKTGDGATPWVTLPYDQAEIVSARSGQPTLLARLQQMTNSGWVIQQTDRTQPLLRPAGITGQVNWISFTDPGAQARNGDRWTRLTAATTTTGGTTSTQWNGWDPTTTVSPAAITGFYVDGNSTGIPPNTGALTAITTAAPAPLSWNGTEFSTTAAGQVIDKLTIPGSLTIAHTGVIVKRCVIRGRITGQATAKIWACEVGRFSPTAVNDTMNGFRYSATEVLRCNFYGFLDTMQVNNPSGNPNMLIRDNFFHDLFLVYDSGQSGASGTPNSHDDCIQIIAGGNCTILHNTMQAWGVNYAGAGETLNPATAASGPGPHWNDKTNLNTAAVGGIDSALIINAAQNITNVTFANNLVHGDTSCYIQAYGSTDITNIIIGGNRFGDEAKGGPNAGFWSGLSKGTTPGGYTNGTYGVNVRDSTGVALD